MGVPKDENEWLKYEGFCTLFAGAELNEPYTGDPYDYPFWTMEDEDLTRLKLSEALKTVGVVCDFKDITLNPDIYEGTVQCVCICYYNKPYQVYNSEFFLNNLTQSNDFHWPVEFYFKSRLD